MDTLTKILLGYILLRVIYLANPDGYLLDYVISIVLIIGFSMLLDLIDNKS